MEVTNSRLEIYERLEMIAREELHPKIAFSWDARWDEFGQTGNWLTAPDSLDFVELVMRIEEEFNIKIPDDDAAGMRTVSDTVDYISTHMAEKAH